MLSNAFPSSHKAHAANEAQASRDIVLQDTALPNVEFPAITQRKQIPAVVWRCLLLYLFLLLCLAPLGVYNQRLYQAEWDLIDYKADLLESQTNLRVAEARTRSPEAIREWAFLQGMIPNAEVETVGRSGYYYQPVPVVPASASYGEVDTTWR